MWSAVFSESVVWPGGWGNKGSKVDWGQAGSMVADHTEKLGRVARAEALGGEQVIENIRYVQAPWSRGLGK